MGNLYSEYYMLLKKTKDFYEGLNQTRLSASAELTKYRAQVKKLSMQHTFFILSAISIMLATMILSPDLSVLCGVSSLTLFFSLLIYAKLLSDDYDSAISDIIKTLDRTSDIGAKYMYLVNLDSSEQAVSKAMHRLLEQEDNIPIPILIDSKTEKNNIRFKYLSHKRFLLSSIMLVIFQISYCVVFSIGAKMVFDAALADYNAIRIFWLVAIPFSLIFLVISIIEEEISKANNLFLSTLFTSMYLVLFSIGTNLVSALSVLAAIITITVAVTLTVISKKTALKIDDAD